MAVTDLNLVEHAIRRRLAAAALAVGEPILAVQVAKVALLTGLAVGLVSAVTATRRPATPAVPVVALVVAAEVLQVAQQPTAL